MLKYNDMNMIFFDLILKMAVVMYFVLCALTVYDTEVNSEKGIIVNENTTMKGRTQEGVLYWVSQTKKSINAEKPSEIEVEDSIIIDDLKLQEVLDEKFYINKTDNITSGLFMPIVVLKYFDKDGGKYEMVYSSMNSEVKIYINDKFERSMMVYDMDELMQKFESL